MWYLRRSWIIVLLLFLSACGFGQEEEPTPTGEVETRGATAENQSPPASPSPTRIIRSTITPTLRATSPASDTPIPQVKPISNAIFIRSGPGERFEQIAVLNEDESARVIGTDEFGDWYEIRTDDGQEGWVAASVVETFGGRIGPTASPTPRPRITAEPGTTQLRVTIHLAYVRSGPGQNYPVIDTVSGESTVTVLGQASNGTWFNIRLSNGRAGWIGATVTEPVGGWTPDEIGIAGTIPAPPPTPQNNCDPAYPTVCIPSPPPDLDCRDIPHQSFTVLPPDPHLFDGNENGLGCEPPTEPAPSSSD